jgi:hypothetical protein
MKAYQSALAGELENGKPPRVCGNPRTFDSLTQLYFSSPEYLRLTPGRRGHTPLSSSD